MVMLMVMMMRVLQGHVGGDHLAARDSAAIVERVVRHSVLCPASGLAENIIYHQISAHVCIRIMLGYPTATRCVQSFN